MAGALVNQGEGDASGSTESGECRDRASGLGPRPLPRRPYVLLVEDDAALVRTLRWAVLAKCNVTAVATAREARERLDGEWDVFLFDIALPDGCGLKLMRLAREVRPQASALVISGEDRRQNVDAAIAMGASFLAKPFAPSEIVQFLDSCLSDRRGAGIAKGSHQPVCDFSGLTEMQEEAGLVPSPFPPEIALLVAQARASGAQSASADSQHTHDLALLARAVSSGHLSAANFDACAKATGVSRQMLQNFATLTSRWDPERIAEMLAMTDRCGRPISKIVLLKVARGPSSLRRAFDEQIAKGEVDLAALLLGLAPGKKEKS